MARSTVVLHDRALMICCTIRTISNIVILSLAAILFLISAASADDQSQKAQKYDHNRNDADDMKGNMVLSQRFDEVISFEEGFSVIWGDIVHLHPQQVVQLKLDKSSGSGFVSLENYMYAYYSASIKLPRDYTAGIVLAFYTSNGDDYPKSHDELDFEFLGNVKGKPWRLQTNIYGNGSVSRGREERFNFWFDPTIEFHNYSILWNHKHIVFMVDDVPIREMKNSEELGGDYPSKPMSLYATMWDGSSWATNGGKYPVNYKYAPFLTSLKNFKIEGCATNPILEEEIESTTQNMRSKMNECRNNPVKAADLWTLTSTQIKSLQWVRSRYLYYTYCQDTSRHYFSSLPECSTQAPITLTKPHGYKGHHAKQRPHTTSIGL